MRKVLCKLHVIMRPVALTLTVPCVQVFPFLRLRTRLVIYILSIGKRRYTHTGMIYIRT